MSNAASATDYQLSWAPDFSSEIDAALQTHWPDNLDEFQSEEHGWPISLGFRVQAEDPVFGEKEEFLCLGKAVSDHQGEVASVLRAKQLHAAFKAQTALGSGRLDWLDHCCLISAANRSWDALVLLHNAANAGVSLFLSGPLALALSCHKNVNDWIDQLSGSSRTDAHPILVSFAPSIMAQATLIGSILDQKPDANVLILAHRGVMVRGVDGKACVNCALALLETFKSWLAQTRNSAPFGGILHSPSGREEKLRVALRTMPVIRGMISGNGHKIGLFDDRASLLELVNAQSLPDIAALIPRLAADVDSIEMKPLVLPSGFDDEQLGQVIERETARLAASIAKNNADQDQASQRQPVDPSPNIFLLPGIGGFFYAQDPAACQNLASVFLRALEAIRYSGNPEALNPLSVEYQGNRQTSKPSHAAMGAKPVTVSENTDASKQLDGKVAVVTGSAGGIGLECARALLAQGATVVLCDIDPFRLDKARRELVDGYANADDELRFELSVLAVEADVTSEADMTRLIDYTVLQFGGLDILVANAGIAHAAAFDETTIDDWDRVASVLTKGVFLPCRQAFKAMKRQGLGGSIIVIGSKNGLAASDGASAYCSSKASALHLTRCMALEGAPYGIRANSVNPDAVLKGSGIWQGDWLKSRLEQHQVGQDGLADMYRERSLLKRSVFCEDVANAVVFLASDLSDKSTGNIINVDAGNAGTFTR